MARAQRLRTISSLLSTVRGSPVSRIGILLEALRTRLLRSQLAHDTGWSFILRVAATGLAFLSAVLLARLLDADGYGVYAYALALATLVFLPVQVGLPALIVRETARGHALDQPALVKGIWVWAGRLTGGVALVLAVGAVLFLLIENDGHLDTAAWTLIWAFLLMPLVALGELRGAALRGLDKLLAGQFPEFILRPVALIALLGVYALVVDQLTPSAAMALRVIAATIAFGVGAWLLRKSTPTSVRQAERRIESRLWLRSALPLALVGGMVVVNSYADILMIGYWETADQVGIYKVATTAAALGAFGLQAVNLVVAPRFVRLHAQNDIARLQRVVTGSARLALVTSLGITAFLVVFGRPMLKLAFGDQFIPAYGPLVILLGGQVVNSAAGSVGQLLNMTGHEKDTARAVAAAAVANVVMNLYFIPRWGVVGAAVASALSVIVWNGWLILAVRRRLGIDSTALGFRQKVVE